MLLGIRAINDFAFKKTFGSPENRACLVSLLNAILRLKGPIVDVVIQNPFNLKDFQEDKLSVLDIKAVDVNGAIYDVEIQLTTYEGLVQRMVFYGCELFAGQVKSGEQYDTIKPVYTIWLVVGTLWPDSEKVHHVFRLTDKESGRALEETLEIHTLELGRYNLPASALGAASVLDRWLFWLLHAHEYEPAELAALLPEPAIVQATGVLAKIAEMTEDKAMYDAREKAIRDRNWELGATFREGEVKGKIAGEIKTIRILQELLKVPLAEPEQLSALTLEQLQSMTNTLQGELRNRTPA